MGLAAIVPMLLVTSGGKLFGLHSTSFACIWLCPFGSLFTHFPVKFNFWDVILIRFDVQDSPLFKYLCNLSPIKPAKSVHHAQTYNEMTFPPEPRIFASPRSARRTSASSLKR